jgi:glycosyltransferase involved in cell wall biosynthesis
MRDTSPFILYPFLSHEAIKVKDYEGMIVHSFDHTLAVSEEDCRALLAAERTYCERIGRDPSDPSRLSIIPIAVDTSAYTRMPTSGSNVSVLTLGTLHYPPNADGIRWFLHEVFPLVQKEIDGATLTIIGKNPPNDLVSTASASNGAVRVTGYVPDLQPYLRKADVLVVPVRAGGGMRVRILEGLAWGIPMVTTTIGLEGIEAIPERDILVEDDVEGFARAVCLLLQSEDLRSKVSSSGRRFVKQQYDWFAVLRELEHVYA